MSEKISNLVNNWGYTRTEKFNGRLASIKRQVVTVIDAANVPSDWNGDKRIVAKATVEGRRGAQYDAIIFNNGFISVIG